MGIIICMTIYCLIIQPFILNVTSCSWCITSTRSTIWTLNGFILFTTNVMPPYMQFAKTDTNPLSLKNPLPPYSLNRFDPTFERTLSPCWACFVQWFHHLRLR
jgi:hypothetical protein